MRGAGSMYCCREACRALLGCIRYKKGCMSRLGWGGHAGAFWGLAKSAVQHRCPSLPRTPGGSATEPSLGPAAAKGPSAPAAPASLHPASMSLLFVLPAHIATTSLVRVAAQVLLLDRYGSTAEAVARELAKKGYSKVYVVSGEWVGGSSRVCARLKGVGLCGRTLCRASGGVVVWVRGWMDGMGRGRLCICQGGRAWAGGRTAGGRAHNDAA